GGKKKKKKRGPPPAVGGGGGRRRWDEVTPAGGESGGHRTDRLRGGRAVRHRGKPMRYPRKLPAGRVHRSDRSWLCSCGLRGLIFGRQTLRPAALCAPLRKSRPAL